VHGDGKLLLVQLPITTFIAQGPVKKEIRRGEMEGGGGGVRTPGKREEKERGRGDKPDLTESLGAQA